MRKFIQFFTVTIIAFSASILSADIKPAVIYDMGGKFDKSFNESVYNGAQRFTKETGIKVMEFEVTNEAQREQGMRKMAQRGANVIVCVGFAQADACDKVAKEFPNTKFSIIDVGWLDNANMRQYVFKEHEGSFLVGALAAMASKTGKVGFVGGMDIPLIRKFACGYVQGAKAVNSKVEVYQNMTGTTPAAWNDPAKGSELAKSQFDRGADVVYAAAGGTGAGVYQAAADSGMLAIGVDSNQNYMHPGTMLTSMLKRVDLATYETFMDVKSGNFTSGVKVLGLAEDGVGWALDEHNESLITDVMKSTINGLSDKVKSGSIKVHDYMSDNNCPS
jgi:basic membrane protein A